MRFDTTAQPCIMTSIVGNTGAKPCATRVARDRRKVHRNGMTIGSSPAAPSTTRATLARIQPTTFDHFDERWSRQSDEKHTAVDPARDAELMTRHTGEAPRIDDRSRSNRAVDLTSLQSGFTSDPAMLQLRREARGSYSYGIGHSCSIVVRCAPPDLKSLRLSAAPKRGWGMSA